MEDMPIETIARRSLAQPDRAEVQERVRFAPDRPRPSKRILLEWVVLP